MTDTRLIQIWISPEAKEKLEKMAAYSGRKLWRQFDECINIAEQVDTLTRANTNAAIYAQVAAPATASHD